MNRKQKRALGRSGAKPARRLAAGSAAGGRFSDLLGAAAALHRAGALAEAERQYRHIVTLFPGSAETHSRLGAVLMAQGNTGQAIGHIERALALKPDLFEAYGNLAQAYMAEGQMEPAVHVLARALEIRDMPQGRALFAHWIKTIRFRGSVDARVRRLVLRALVESWAQPRELTAACVSLLKCGGIVNDCIRRADAAWPARLPATELFGASGPAALSADGLLCRLLECDPITDVAIERFLTNVRSAMLTIANGEDRVVDERELEFYSAVARQCFINEYVYAPAESEEVRARELQSALAQKSRPANRFRRCGRLPSALIFRFLRCPTLNGYAIGRGRNALQPSLSSRSTNRRRNAGLRQRYLPSPRSRTKFRARCACNMKKVRIRAGSKPGPRRSRPSSRMLRRSKFPTS